MAFTASCPSCGAPVEFKSAGSLFAVCAYCQSTLVRHDQALEDIGKMAALVEDRSPLQLGTTGQWKGVHFALIGRIQLRYSQGLWNEWYVLFDDRRTGWLSEAGGEYVLTFLQALNEPVPAFADLQAGQRVQAGGRAWQVTNLEKAECVAGAGELPFKVGAGYPAPVADLRQGDAFATLDYSEDQPLLFVGQAVDFAELRAGNLREEFLPTPKKLEAKVFRCPNCGAPMSARSSAILAVGCGTCGTVVDTADETYRILSRALGLRDENETPILPLGSKGKLDGEAVEVIGFMVRETVQEGIHYPWREFLLAAPNGRYRWLVESSHHWAVVDVLSRHPEGAMGNFAYDGESYKHFASYSATVIQVSGEFTWRVARGETVLINDFVAPPLILSQECAEREISWSRGRYAEPAEIAAAFKLKQALPEPYGAGAHQPNPWQDTHRNTCRFFWKTALCAVILQGLFYFFSDQHLHLRETVRFTPQVAEEGFTSRPFELKGKVRKLTVQHNTNLYNNWVGVDLTLVNQSTGAAWPASQELSYYAGVEDGESWSEGDQRQEVSFAQVPPGRYVLVVDPELPPDNTQALADQIEVTSGGLPWSNFILLLLLLAAFPIFTRMRVGAFEVRRWAESDHPLVTEQSEDD